MAFQPAILGLATVGNTPLGYVPAGLTEIRQTRVRITVAGTIVRYRRGSVTIRDVINDAPNTCSLTINADTPPQASQRIRITINSDDPRLLFDGAVETVTETYDLLPTQIAYYCTAQDDTPRANRRIPLGYWENVSATIVAQELIAQFAPGFTTTHVQASLPAITVHFEGSEAGMNGCLRQIAKLIGGYFYWEARDLHLFTADNDDVPAALDSTPGRFLDEPHIAITRDDSQIRTRVYGKGHAEFTLAEVAASASSIPVGDVSMYNPAGGQVISESQILNYTGVQAGGGGALVGPGASPSAAPVAALAAGSGIESGAHGYAVTFTTGAGESIVGPSTSITVGTVPAPTAAPTPASLSSGGSVDAGSHDYAYTSVTASGETTPSPISSAIATGGAADAPPTNAPTAGTPTAGGSVTAGAHTYATTFVSASGETAAGPESNSVTAVAALGAPAAIGSPETRVTGGSIEPGTYEWKLTFVTALGETTGSPSSIWTIAAGDAIRFDNITVGPSGTTARRLYRSAAGQNPPFKLVTTIANNASGQSVTDTLAAASLGATIPASNTTAAQTVPLTGIQTGPGGTTARKVYRTEAGGSQLKLLTTINNNSTTTFSDTIADGSLGANVPTGATLNTVNVTGIAVGTPAVTSRKVYRRFNGAGTFKLVATIGDNTTTTYTDTTANASLGAAAPTSNTATANQVSLSSIQLGGATVTGRKVYRTTAGGAQLKLLATIGDNTTTTYADSTADASLGANVPTSDTSGLVQPSGQVSAGSTSLIVASAAAFTAAGGFAIIGNGQQVIRYTGVTGASLTGIPATGVGAITASVGYNSTVTAAPALTGVSGLIRPLIKGAPINIWVQRDDVAAQQELAIREGEGGDGIIEHRIVDERRGYESLAALCDADLSLFSRPIVTVTYADRHVLNTSGKPLVVDLPSPAIDDTLVIQDVTITELDIAPRLAPKFTVTASSMRFSIEDLLRRMASSLDGV